jgi:hypothetical protein
MKKRRRSSSREDGIANQVEAQSPRFTPQDYAHSHSVKYSADVPGAQTNHIEGGSSPEVRVRIIPGTDHFSILRDTVLNQFFMELVELHFLGTLSRSPETDSSYDGQENSPNTLIRIAHRRPGSGEGTPQLS